MRYHVLKTDPELGNAVGELMQLTGKVRVFPGPGVVQEALASRGFVVDMSLDEEKSAGTNPATFLVTRRAPIASTTSPQGGQ